MSVDNMALVGDAAKHLAALHAALQRFSPGAKLRLEVDFHTYASLFAEVSLADGKVTEPDGSPRILTIMGIEIGQDNRPEINSLRAKNSKLSAKIAQRTVGLRRLLKRNSLRQQVEKAERQ